MSQVFLFFICLCLLPVLAEAPLFYCSGTFLNCAEDHNVRLRSRATLRKVFFFIFLDKTILLIARCLSPLPSKAAEAVGDDWPPWIRALIPAHYDFWLKSIPEQMKPRNTD